jgi:hypothetical protein
MNQSATNEKSGIQATLELCTPIAALSTDACVPKLVVAEFARIQIVPAMSEFLRIQLRL